MSGNGYCYDCFKKRVLSIDTDSITGEDIIKSVYGFEMDKNSGDKYFRVWNKDNACLFFKNKFFTKLPKKGMIFCKDCRHWEVIRHIDG